MTTADMRPLLQPDTQEIARAFVYAAPALALVDRGIVFCLFILALAGLVSFFRGATIPRGLDTVAIVFAVWFCVLFGLEAFNTGAAALPVRANSYLVLLAFPFFVIGLREAKPDPATFEWSVMLTSAFAAAFSIVQVFLFGMQRAEPFELNSIQFGLAACLMNLFIAARAFSPGRIDRTRVLFALVGIIPVLLAGSRMVWIALFVGYAIIIFMRAGRRPWILLGAAGATLLLALLAVATNLGRTRLAELVNEVSAYASTGVPDNASVGLRIAINITGWAVFVQRPITGFGLTMANADTLSPLRPPRFPDFSQNLHLHNEYLTHIVAFGVPGLLFVLTLLAAFVFVYWRTGRAEHRTFGLAGGAVVALHMTSESFLFWPAVYGFFFFMMGIPFLPRSSRHARSEATEASPNTPNAPQTRRPGWGVVDALTARSQPVFRAFAYIAVPAALVGSGAAACILAVAAWGAVCFARGGPVPKGLAPISALFVGWFTVLVLLDTLGGASFGDISPIAATIYFLLLAFPFYVIGMRESGAELRVFSRLIRLTVLLASAQLLLQILVLHIPLPPALPGLYLSGGYSLVITLFGMFVLADSLTAAKPDLGGIAIALFGLVAVVINDVRIVWVCALLGYALVVALWAVAERRWLTISGAALALVAGVFGALQTQAVRSRIEDLTEMAGAVVNSGEAIGTFGIRYREIVDGWRAFVGSPIVGNGLVPIFNDHMQHLVAFGIAGVLFVLTMLVTLPVAARWSRNPLLARFSVAAAIVLAVYMAASPFLSNGRLSGVFYLLCALAFLPYTVRPEADRETTPASGTLSERAA